MTKAKVYSITTGDVYKGKTVIPMSADASPLFSKGFNKYIRFQTFSKLNSDLYSVLAKQIMDDFAHVQSIVYPDTCAMRVSTNRAKRTFIDFVIEQSVHDEFKPYTRNQLLKHIPRGYDAENPVTRTLGSVVSRLFPDILETTIPSDDVSSVVQHMELLSLYLSGVTGNSWVQQNSFDELDEFFEYTDNAPSQSVINPKRLVTALRKVAEDANTMRGREFYSERVFEGDFVLINNRHKNKIGDFRAIEYTAQKHHVIETMDEFNTGAMIFPSKTKIAEVTVNRNQVFTITALNVGKYNDIMRWVRIGILDDKGKKIKTDRLLRLDTLDLIDPERRSHVLDDFIRDELTFISSKAVELTK